LCISFVFFAVLLNLLVLLAALALPALTLTLLLFSIALGPHTADFCLQSTHILRVLLLPLALHSHGILEIFHPLFLDGQILQQPLVYLWRYIATISVAGATRTLWRGDGTAVSLKSPRVLIVAVIVNRITNWRQWLDDGNTPGKPACGLITLLVAAPPARLVLL
jgi:hypothetical protein